MGMSLPPPEGVRESPLTVTTKERIDVPGGGVRGTAASVTLRVASPWPPPPLFPPFFTPLQELRRKIAAIATNTAFRLEFMQIPLLNVGPALGSGWLESPTTL
jgi:hypothetical protein